VSEGQEGQHMTEGVFDGKVAVVTSVVDEYQAAARAP
jgi:hypothetical protein